MLSAENISLKIGRRNILHRISFSALPGEVLAIMGANGAGKSTLLKILSGDLIPDKGSIFLNHWSVNQYKKNELSKIRAVLSQSFPQNIPYRAEEIVMMGRYPHFNETPSDYDRSVVKEAMREVQILHLMNRSYASLSGGEQQRVHIARVLAQIWKEDTIEQAPKFLFLDEPVSSLDILHQHRTLEITGKLKKSGYVVVAVLHDLNLAAQYADKVLMLGEGEVIAHGKIKDTLTEKTIQQTFGLQVSIIPHPDYGFPVIMPKYKHADDPLNRFQIVNIS